MTIDLSYLPPETSAQLKEDYTSFLRGILKDCANDLAQHDTQCAKACPCATCATLAPGNPYSEMLCVETLENRLLAAELDEWCAKVRRVDVPLPLYSDEELAQVPLPECLRWDIPKKERFRPRSNDFIPEACDGPLTGPIPSSVWSGETRP